MITDDMLREAAAKSNEAYVRYLEQDYDPDHQHDFSKGFEQKIRKLNRKARHPFLYRSLQRTAAILLVIILSGTVWLSVDSEARAFFFGWIREVYETYISYRFEGSYNSGVAPEAYRPTWLPIGYEETYLNSSKDIVTVIYTDDNSQNITFSYIRNPSSTAWFFDNDSLTTAKQAYVNGLPADLWLADNIETASVIVWTDSQNTGFYISGFLDEADLIKMAESVQ